jgi:hypothetical protein
MRDRNLEFAILDRLIGPSNTEKEQVKYLHIAMEL